MTILDSQAPMTTHDRRLRDERGQATVMIVGFAVVLAMAIAMVIDASAAYLQRQGLSSLADGAALRGADLGATGEDIYTGGLPGDRLRLTAAEVSASVRAYLHDVGAYATYPGLTYVVDVDQGTNSVSVDLHAPLDLPLSFPGSPDHPSIGAVGSAVVTID